MRGTYMVRIAGETREVKAEEFYKWKREQAYREAARATGSEDYESEFDPLDPPEDW